MPNVGHKENRELIRIATRNGARVVSGKNHIKIYDGGELVAVLSYGSGKSDRYPGGMKAKILAKFKSRGWDIYA